MLLTFWEVKFRAREYGEEAYSPFKARPFSRFTALCIYSFPRAKLHASRFTSSVPFELPWEEPDYSHLADY